MLSSASRCIKAIRHPAARHFETPSLRSSLLGPRCQRLRVGPPHRRRRRCLPSSPGRRSSAGSCGSRISASSAIRIRRRRRSCCAGDAAGSSGRRRAAAAVRSDPLLGDAEARVRRRAALAVGRVGLPEGVEPLTRLLTDGEIEVRQMAAFALGLIGDALGTSGAARGAQGSAADRAGARRRGARPDRRSRRTREPIGAMVQAHVKAGALTGIAPDDLTLSAGAAGGSRHGSASTRWCGSARTTRWPPRCSTQRAAGVDAGGRSPTRCSGVGDRARRAGAARRCSIRPGATRPSFAVRGLGVDRRRRRRRAGAAADRRAAAVPSRPSSSRPCGRWRARRCRGGARC